MNQKLRAVVVGCGYFGQKRIEACRQLKHHIQLVGVVDVDEKKAKKTGQVFHVPHATSLKSLLKIYSADIAIVCVPNKQHAPVTCEALKSGLHVLCEKPLAPTVAEANKIVRASQRFKRFVKTGSNHRFFPSIQKAVKLIRRGTIGKVLSVKGNIGTDGSHTKQSWFWDKATSGGGTYVDNACHLLDITRWIMGDFYSCTGMISNVFWKKAHVEDLAGGLYKTKDGRMALITSSWSQWKGYMSLEIWGEKGYMLIDSKRGDNIIVGNRESKKERIYDFSKRQPVSYMNELLYFASCIQKGLEPEPRASDGTAVIRMIEGVYRSVKQERVIKLSSVV